MREILFRGKRCDNGEWVQGYYIRADHHWHKHGIHKDWIALGASANGGWFVLHNKYAVKSETVGQFTGLTDKNGKKIFEGDIVKSDNGKRSAVSVVCYGEFLPRMFYDLLENFVMPRPKEKLVGLFLRSTKNGEEMFLSNGSKLIEIIGNIHDDPELLRGEEDGKENT